LILKIGYIIVVSVEEMILYNNKIIVLYNREISNKESQQDRRETNL